MDIDNEFPLKVCLNLERREDRRRYASELFRIQHLKVRRWVALDGRKSRRSGIFFNPSRRAKHLSFLGVIRHARAIRAAGVLFFEDDVVLAPDFLKRVDSLEVPEDWGMLYFGCLHVESPVKISGQLVRITRAYDTHAVGIRACWFEKILRALGPKALRGLAEGSGRASDVLLADLQKEIPSYAAYPNLAWQRKGLSDLTGSNYAHYSADGEQIHFTGSLRDL